MNDSIDAFLRSWPFDPWLLGSLAVAAAIYLRGWKALRRRDSARWLATQPLCFVFGLTTIYLALASPIDPFSSLLLQIHMLQHVLLMMLAPPLLWLGSPFFPLLRGLPRWVRTTFIAPLFRFPPLRLLFDRVTHPFVALPIFLAVNFGWHLPAAYGMALRYTNWHYAQHLCFLASSLLFWYPVVRPYPSRPRWSPWLLLPYLLIADVANTAFSAILTFSDRAFYSHYASVPRLWGVTVLADQSAAGVLMWIPGSIAFLLPFLVIGVRLFSRPSDAAKLSRQFVPTRARRPAMDNLHSPTLAHPLARPPALTAVCRSRSTDATDQWASPVLTLLDNRRLAATVSSQSKIQNPKSKIRTLLYSRHTRIVIQSTLALIALALILDGLTGPQVGAMNLAGVLPWIHWRGLVVVGLLTAGNVFCYACPFTLPRKLAGSWFRVDRSWPKALRSKWLAVGLVGLFLWSYEAFSLWDSPWWTAWIAIGYFAAAFAVDSVFRGSSFCKYVCPIGQFHFVQSLVSPFEVRVRDPATCASCRTADCIQGRDALPGCQLGLFQPKKSGNMDCSFCLDCVRACPHDNVGLIAAIPMKSAWTDPTHSGVRRITDRPDLAALVLVLVFGAFANAAGMVAPVLEWQHELKSRLGAQSLLPITTLYYLFALVVLPLSAVATATTLTRCVVTTRETWPAVATRFSFALVPIGFAMWLAHYSFHFFTSYQTVVPIAQRFALDFGWSALGLPAWSRACCQPIGDWLLVFEILALDVGLLVSLYTLWHFAKSTVPNGNSAMRAALPWAVLLCTLFALGIWIVFQPMQMRGTMVG